MTRAAPTTTPLAAVAGVVAAAVLGVAAAAGTGAVVVAVVAVAVAVAAGWPGLLALPSPRGTSAVVAMGGAAAALTAVLTPGPARLRYLPVVLGLSLLGAFVHQLARRDGRPRVVDGLSGAVTGLLVVVLGAGWLAALAVLAGGAGSPPGAGGPGGVDLVVTGAAAAAGAALAALVPGPLARRGLAAVVLAAAAAALAAGVDGVGAGDGALLGGGCGLLAALVGRVLGSVPSARQLLPALALGVAPVAVTGVVVDLLGQVLLT